MCLTVNGLSLGVEDHGDALCHAGRKAPEELRLQLPPALLGARWFWIHDSSDSASTHRLH